MTEADAAGEPAAVLRSGARREPSTHQLRLLVVLAQELHFGRAAERMCMTQPSFSQQIRALEERLGVPLIDRTSRTVGFTTAGNAVLSQGPRGVAVDAPPSSAR
ncbi:MAG TPA: LysR family transcriptional regulator [Amycolatopsis sp.]|nr:LysR family transcriptional regulator [Amycolatopsis sp.]